jgi:hypothetical protein
MLPAVLRRRLDRLSNLQLSFLASQRDDIQSDPATFSEIDFACCIPPSSRPTSAGSKGSTVSISADTSGTSTPEVDRLSAYEIGSGLRWNRVAPGTVTRFCVPFPYRHRLI